MESLALAVALLVAPHVSWDTSLDPTTYCYSVKATADLAQPFATIELVTNSNTCMVLFDTPNKFFMCLSVNSNGINSFGEPEW